MSRASELAREGTATATIGHVVQRRRKRLGLSQADLAARVGLSQQAIAHIETAPPTTLPHYAHLHLLCDALDLSLDDLPPDILTGETRANARAFFRERMRATIVGCMGQRGYAVEHLRYAEGCRRRGDPCAGEREAREVIRLLSPLVAELSDNAALPMALFSAYGLAARCALETFTPNAVAAATGDCQRMLDLAVERLDEDGEAVARALCLLADARMLSGARPRLLAGWQASERALALTRDPVLRAHGWRVRVALARRLGRVDEAVRGARAAERELAARPPDPFTAAFAYQGMALNLAHLPERHRQEARAHLALAECAYQEGIAQGGIETHVEALLLRTRAVLAALAGPGHDRQLAREVAQRGLAKARAACRERTAQHCAAILHAATSGQPLAIVALQLS